MGGLVGVGFLRGSYMDVLSPGMTLKLIHDDKTWDPSDRWLDTHTEEPVAPLELAK